MGDLEAEATYQRGRSHLLGSDGVEPSVALAMSCFERAAQRGHAAAQYSLAACLLTDDEDGAGCLADPIAAVRWLERAAEQHHAAAQHELGLCFASGTGVTQDLSAAVALYTKAAAQGLGNAQCALAECLLSGTGVPVDIDRAQALFRAALAQGVVPDRSMSYEECLSIFPHDTAASVGWLDGQEAQHRRFEALLEIGVPTPVDKSLFLLFVSDSPTAKTLLAWTQLSLSLPCISQSLDMRLFFVQAGHGRRLAA